MRHFVFREISAVDLNVMQTISRSLSPLFISPVLVKAAYLSANVPELPAHLMARPHEINQLKTAIVCSTA